MSASSPHSSQQLLAYAQATYSWEAGQKSEDELLQRIWNLADDVGRLIEQLEAALRVVEAAEIAYDGFGEDDHRFYGSQKRLAEALEAWRGASTPASVQGAPSPVNGDAETSGTSGRPAPDPANEPDVSERGPDQGESASLAGRADKALDADQRASLPRSETSDSAPASRSSDG